MRTIGSLIVALLVAILLAVTNPTVDDFAVYMRSAYAQETKQSGTSDPMSAMVDSFTGWMAAEYAGRTVQRDDYVVFSLYSVKIDRTTERWVGVLKQFVRLP